MSRMLSYLLHTAIDVDFSVEARTRTRYERKRGATLESVPGGEGRAEKVARRSIVEAETRGKTLRTSTLARLTRFHVSKLQLIDSGDVLTSKQHAEVLEQMKECFVADQKDAVEQVWLVFISFKLK